MDSVVLALSGSVAAPAVMLFALLSITLRPVTARSLAGSAAAGVIDAQLPTWSAHPVNQTALPMTHSSIDPLKPHAACGNATTFVTFITGARYATAASCLPQMLRNVGSRCPLLLIYNDADTELPLSRLKQAYGKGQMVPLSHLKAHYYEWSRSLRQVLRLWMIMSVLVCVELPGARVLPGIVRLTCVHGRRLWYAREPRTESVYVCFVRF